MLDVDISICKQNLLVVCLELVLVGIIQNGTTHMGGDDYSVGPKRFFRLLSIERMLIAIKL